jgi:endogenous inhibitor of DNA gyrase (YacG/DUF329 family)
MSHCPNCGRSTPPEQETGYDGEDFCSARCEDLYTWEREENVANVQQLAHEDQLQKTLAAYLLFIYPLQTQQIHANDVTTPETERSE